MAARGCPVCGCKKYKGARVDPNQTVIVKPRICQECGHRYVVPLPRWIGLMTYLAAAMIVGSMIVDWLAPPTDWFMHFTWKGRVAVLIFAGFLVGMGTLVIKGKTGYE